MTNKIFWEDRFQTDFVLIVYLVMEPKGLYVSGKEF